MKIALFAVALAAAVIALTGVLAPELLPHAGLTAPTAMAMVMMPAHRGFYRGARADGGDVAKVLAELQKTFEAFKQERDEELKGIKAKFADVVQTEKVDRINAEITTLQKSLDDINAALAAVKVGGGSGDAPDPVKAEHAKAFDRFFRNGVEAGLSDLEVKAKLTTQSNPDGGYLVPEEVEKTIDRVLGVMSVMRQIATVMPLNAPTYKKFVNMGGAGAGWVGEDDARSETATPKLRMLEFPTMELFAMPGTTQTMLDDGIIDIGAWLADEVNITFAEQEGAAFVSGNGVKRPRGLLTYDTVANDSWAWGKVGFVASGAAAGFATPSTTVSPADCLLDLYYALKAGYRQNAAFLTSDAVMPTLRKFKDLDGNYIWAPPTGAAEVSTIFGKPVYTDDNMPAVGAGAFPIAFGDFKRAYLIVDRVGMRVLRDPFTSKPNVLFYTTKRVGGGLANFEAVKFLKIST